MNISIFSGGFSSERAVSFESTENVYNIIKDKYNVTLFDIGRAEKYKSIKKQSNKKPKSWNINIIQNIINHLKNDNINFVIIMLHGGFGEDGHIQSLLDMCNIPYSGSKAGPSYIGINKIITKQIMHYYNIPTPKAFFINKNTNLKKLQNKLNFPVIIKPSKEGSTIGINIVKNKNNFIKSATNSLEYDKNVLIEEYIKGTEMTLTVMNNKAYPIVKIIPKTGFYDYKRKYTDGESKYVCPPKIDNNIKKSLNNNAIKLYEKMDLSGVVRFDFLLTKDNKFYFLEVNTLPGMTAHSLVPMAFDTNNISKEKLIEKIIDSGLNNEKK